MSIFIGCCRRCGHIKMDFCFGRMFFRRKAGEIRKRLHTHGVFFIRFAWNKTCNAQVEHDNYTHTTIACTLNEAYSERRTYIHEFQILLHHHRRVSYIYVAQARFMCVTKAHVLLIGMDTEKRKKVELLQYK